MSRPCRCLRRQSSTRRSSLRSGSPSAPRSSSISAFAGTRTGSRERRWHSRNRSDLSFVSALRVTIIGSGNIGTDLMYKVLRNPSLELVAVVGVDPASDGLARARDAGIWTTPQGLGHYLEEGPPADLAIEATSADAHLQHAPMLAARGIRCIDLTPSGLGPAVVPDVNLKEHLEAPDVSLITCGAQATVPIVRALVGVRPVDYAEIVSTVASRSAGPGTRRNIDEFTVATARSLGRVGGARPGKAIMILNP